MNRVITATIVDPRLETSGLYLDVMLLIHTASGKAVNRTAIWVSDPSSAVQFRRYLQCCSMAARLCVASKLHPQTSLSSTPRALLYLTRRNMSSHAGSSEDGARSTKMVPCQNGINIFTKTWGEPSSHRKTVALHGYLDNTGTFDLLGPALAKEGFEVVAIDFPGHGKSDSVSSESWYAMLDYPEYVLEAARSLGWERFSLVGHSMGGAVATLVSASFPELVERLVSIDILGPWATNPGSSPWHLRRSIESRRNLLTKGARPYASFDEAVQRRLQSVTMWGEGQTMSLNGAKRLVAGGSKPYGEDGQVIFTNDVRARAHSPGYLSEEAVMAYLEAVQCPGMVIRGESGMVTETPSFLGRKEAFGAKGGGILQDLVLPGSHHLHLDDETAPLVAEDVAAFLNGRELRMTENLPVAASSSL